MVLLPPHIQACILFCVIQNTGIKPKTHTHLLVYLDAHIELFLMSPYSRNQ